jgi:hypothetical protein
MFCLVHDMRRHRSTTRQIVGCAWVHLRISSVSCVVFAAAEMRGNGCLAACLDVISKVRWTEFEAI